MKQIRFITHDENHVDEETLFGDVWAVTRCDCELTNAALLPDKKEIDMNGWTPVITAKTRIDNLIAQIPQAQRARACVECYGENDGEFERNLTGYVMRRRWEYEQQQAEAADIIDWLDTPKTDLGIDLIAKLGEIPTSRPHTYYEMTGAMNNADYDDLRNLAIGR
jgi:hypothetical protein